MATLRVCTAFACLLAFATDVSAQDKPQPKAAPKPSAPTAAPATPAPPAAETPPATPAAQAAPDSAAPEAAPAEGTAESAPAPDAAQPTEPAPAPSPAAAEPPPPPPTYGQLGGPPEPEIEKGEWDPWEHPTPYQRRHDGFYLRLAVGFGGGSVSTDGHIDDSIGDTTASGGGFGWSFAVGGALTDNLILNGDIFFATFFDPHVEANGDEVSSRSAVRNDVGLSDDMRIAGLGIGLTYYFMPVNIYVAASVGFGQLVFEDDSGDVEGSDIGLGGNLMVGKEWWVGPDWGIGLAGQCVLLSTDDEIVGDITGIALNLMFSATYN